MQLSNSCLIVVLYLSHSCLIVVWRLFVQGWAVRPRRAPATHGGGTRPHTSQLVCTLRIACARGALSRGAALAFHSGSDTNFFHRVMIFGCCTRAVLNDCFYFAVLNVLELWSLLGDRTLKSHNDFRLLYKSCC